MGESQQDRRCWKAKMKQEGTHRKKEGTALHTKCTCQKIKMNRSKNENFQGHAQTD